MSTGRLPGVGGGDESGEVVSDEPEPGTPEYDAETEAFLKAISDARVHIVAVSDEDLERLAGYLTEKQRRLARFWHPDPIAITVSTTVADVAMIYRGILDVDDFAPDGLVGIDGPNKDLPATDEPTRLAHAHGHPCVYEDPT